MATYSGSMAGAFSDLVRAAAAAENSTPGTAPDLTDETIIQKQLLQKQRLAAMQGRGSTFLTGPRGLGGPSSEITNAFLLAKLQHQQNQETSPVRIIRVPGTPGTGVDQTPVLTDEERAHMEMPTGKGPKGTAIDPALDTGLKPLLLTGTEMPTGKKLTALSKLFLSGGYAK